MTNSGGCFTNKVMRYAWLYALLALAVLALAQSAFASVVINEVLFNPSATNDTGFEKIELYNNGDANVDLSGWDLYPVGMGYFTIPTGFSLLPKSFVIANLRISGIQDAANLYTGSSFGSGNMSDTSGSVALFNSHLHKKETLVDFVEWSSKAASSTWESSAVGNGLWLKDAPVDTSALGVGSSIALAADGVRQDAGSWRIYSTPTIGGPNSTLAASSASSSGESTSGDQQIQQPEQDILASKDSSAHDSGRPVPPSLKAYAGKDRTAVQGALVEFRGSANGINGETLTSARFSWNFGDGTTKEGKIVSHVYYFPGAYTVSLDVSSGEYAGSDYVKLTVVRPDIFISEVRGGAGGFLELYNNTVNSLDLGGFQLRDGARFFPIPQGTLIQANSALVLPNAVTGLFGELRYAAIFDALDNAVDSGAFSGTLLVEESFERSVAGGQKFIKIKTPTPGEYMLIAAAAGKENGGIPIPANLQKEERTADKAQNMLAAAQEPASAPRQANDESRTKIAASGSTSSSWLLGASIIIGLFAAGGLLFFRLL